MNILIMKKEKNIVTIRNYTNIFDRGEIAHIIAELESIKLDLLELWEEFDENGERNIN